VQLLQELVQFHPIGEGNIFDRFSFSLLINKDLL